MPTIRNLTDGALDVRTADLNRVILPDEEVECSDATAAGCEGNPDWQVTYNDRPADLEDQPAPDDAPREG